jgi:hypothetical protein
MYNRQIEIIYATTVIEDSTIRIIAKTGKEERVFFLTIIRI